MQAMQGDAAESFARDRRKANPLCIPRPPNCGGQEKARDCIRDDTRRVFSANDRVLPLSYVAK
jgi:hypothetical protein